MKSTNVVDRKCPLVRDRAGAKPLPRLSGTALATMLAFGCGLMAAAALTGGPF